MTRTGKTTVPTVAASGAGEHVKSANPAHDHDNAATDAAITAAVAAHVVALHPPVVDPPPIDPAPVLSSVGVTKVSPSSVRISWQVSEPASGNIQYAEGAAGTPQTVPFASGVLSATLVGLKPDTDYSAVLTVVDSAGQFATAPVTFRTDPAVITPGPTPNIPSSIDPTGAQEVTGALQTWLANLPTGAVAVMGNGATYRTDGTVHLSGRSPLTIDWNGSKWQQKVEAFSRIFLIDGGGSQIVLTKPWIVGTNPNPGKWDGAHEHNHGIQIGGVQGITIFEPRIVNVRGDGIYLSGGANKWATGVVVTRPDMDGIGRMGIALTDGVSGFLIDGGTFKRIGYYTLDVEPNGATVGGRLAGAENGVIRNVKAGPKPYGDYPADKTQADGFFFVVTNASGGGVANNIEVYGCESTDPVYPDFRWNSFLPGATLNIHDNVRQVKY